jgi:hypothetical protein
MASKKAQLESLAKKARNKYRAEHVDAFHPDAYGSDGELKPVFREDDDWIVEENEDTNYGYKEDSYAIEDFQDLLSKLCYPKSLILRTG